MLVATFHEGAPNGSLSLEGNEAISPVFTRIVNEVSPKVDALVNGHTHQAYAYNARSRPARSDPTGPADGQLCGQRRSDPADRRPRHRSRVGIHRRECSRVTTATRSSLSHLPAGGGGQHDRHSGAPRRRRHRKSAHRHAEQRRDHGDDARELPFVPYPGFTVTTGPRSPHWATSSPTRSSTLSSRRTEAGPEIAVVNPGGLRGELVYAGIRRTRGFRRRHPLRGGERVLPFVNNLATVDMTGAQLKTCSSSSGSAMRADQVPTRPYLQLGTSRELQLHVRPGARRGKPHHVDDVPRRADRSR